MINKYIFSNFFKNEKKTIIFWTLSILIFYIFQIGVLPHLFGNLSTKIDQLGTNFKLDFKNLNTITYLFIFIIIMVFISLFEKLKKNFEGYIQPKYLLYLRRTILEKILKRYSQDFKDLSKGDLVTRIVTISNGIWDSIYIFANTIFQRIIAIVITIIYFFINDWRLGIVILVCSIFYLYIFQRNIMRALTLSVTKEKKVFHLSEQLNDQLSNLMNVYINNQQQSIINKSNYFLSKYGESIHKEVNTYGNIFLINNTLLILISLIMLSISYYQLYTKNISTAIFISILIVIGMFIHNGYLINQESYPLIIKMAPLLSSKDFLKNIFQDTSDGTYKQKISGTIQFKNVFFRYEKNQDFILNNFNLLIKPNQKIAILGQSGSGKSTICKLLLQFYQPEKGKILIDGNLIQKYQSEFLRKNIVYVNQKTQLFNKNIITNIRFGNDSSDDQILNLINKYNLDIFNNLSNSVYSEAGVEGSNLSLGMQKIVIILRGILRSGKIILFDEPLAGLDRKTRQNVIKLIKDTCKDKTVIIVTHDQEIIPYVDKVVRLNQLNNQS